MSNQNGIENPAHRKFIDHYVDSLNRTDAYMHAYPKSSYEAARRNANRLLTYDDIRSEVNRRLDELAMSKSEVLLHLMELATSSMGDYINIDEDGNATVNLKKAEAAKRLGSIKGLTTTVREKVNGEVVRKTNIQLYDKQVAIDKIARAHGMYDNAKVKVDVHSVDVKSLSDEELERIIDDAKN